MHKLFFYSIAVLTFIATSAVTSEDSSIARGREIEHRPTQLQHPVQHPTQLQHPATTPYHPAARNATQQDINRAADANALENGAVGGAAVYPVYPVTPNTYPITPNTNTPATTNSGTTINVNSTPQVNTPGSPQN